MDAPNSIETKRKLVEVEKLMEDLNILSNAVYRCDMVEVDKDRARRLIERELSRLTSQWNTLFYHNGESAQR